MDDTTGFDIEKELTSFEREAKKYREFSATMSALADQWNDLSNTLEDLKTQKGRQERVSVQYYSLNRANWHTVAISEENRGGFIDIAIREIVLQIKSIKTQIDAIMERMK